MRKKSVTSEMMESYIADSLLLLMEKKDFNKITVGEIVEKAGVNRSTYYRHFNKKEDIILHFLDCLSKPFLEKKRTEDFDYKEYVLDLYEHYYQHKKQMLTIYKNGLSFLLMEILKKYLGEETHRDKNVFVQYNIAFHAGGAFSLLMSWFSRNMVDSPETMAKYTIEILSDGCMHHI